MSDGGNGHPIRQIQIQMKIHDDPVPKEMYCPIDALLPALMQMLDLAEQQGWGEMEFLHASVVDASEPEHGVPVEHDVKDLLDFSREGKQMERLFEVTLLAGKAKPFVYYTKDIDGPLLSCSALEQNKQLERFEIKRIEELPEGAKLT